MISRCLSSCYSWCRREPTPEDIWDADDRALDALYEEQKRIFREESPLARRCPAIQDCFQKCLRPKSPPEKYKTNPPEVEEVPLPTNRIPFASQDQSCATSYGSLNKPSQQFLDAIADVGSDDSL